MPTQQVHGALQCVTGCVTCQQDSMRDLPAPAHFCDWNPGATSPIAQSLCASLYQHGATIVLGHRARSAAKLHAWIAQLEQAKSSGRDPQQTGGQQQKGSKSATGRLVPLVCELVSECMSRSGDLMQQCIQTAAGCIPHNAVVCPPVSPQVSNRSCGLKQVLNELV
jgi:hypothetical protein